MNVVEFKQCFLPCSSKMYVVAWRLTGNVQSAEDLVQETFLKLWTKRDSIDNVGNAEAYCISMLKHIFCDRHRIRHIETVGTSVECLLTSDDGGMAERLDFADESEQVMTLIDKLPEQQRQIITMRDIDGMSFGEIEVCTGLSVGNVRVVLSRARKQIREKFKKIREYGCK